MAICTHEELLTMRCGRGPTRGVVSAREASWSPDPETFPRKINGINTETFSVDTTGNAFPIRHAYQRPPTTAWSTLPSLQLFFTCKIPRNIERLFSRIRRKSSIISPK